MTNPSASELTGSDASGNVRDRRRPSSRGVSPVRRSAPARRARTSVRFQTSITDRGLRYRAAAAKSTRSTANRIPMILVKVPASGRRKPAAVVPRGEPPEPGLLPPGSLTTGLGWPPDPLPDVPHPFALRHGFDPWLPRAIGLYTFAPSAVGLNGIQP